MPNHVTNQITASPEAIRAILRKRTPEEITEHWQQVNPDELIVDFELVVPLPAGYSHGNCDHNHPLRYDENDPHKLCWYSWNRHGWGTKWNGYSTQPVTGAEGDRAKLEFDTAWSHPFPVVEALSRRFPKESIEVAFADEDLGSNCGTYTLLDGVLVEQNFPDYGDESLELAAQIKYGQSYADLKAEWDEEDA